MQDSTRDTVKIEERTPWEDFAQLGVLVQGAEQSLVGMPRAGPPVVYMFKKLHQSVGRPLLQRFQDFKHHNIVQIKHVFAHDSDIYLGMDYLRFTLEEVVHVHLPFTETHVRLLGKSVSDIHAFSDVP